MQALPSAGLSCTGPGLAQTSPGQPEHHCWAGGFLTGQNGDVLVNEESPTGVPSCSGACLRAHHPVCEQALTCTHASCTL